MSVGLPPKEHLNGRVSELGWKTDVFSGSHKHGLCNIRSIITLSVCEELVFE